MRWLRVGQREHYLAGSVTRFAFRWWRLGYAAALAFLLFAVILVATTLQMRLQAARERT